MTTLPSTQSGYAWQIPNDPLAREYLDLLLKRVQVTFSPDRKIVGILMRNSFKNDTLCVRTTLEDNGDGCFFFSPHEAKSIREYSKA